jgi:hypothetical protein
MMEAVQPFVDTAISKTVNVPADYPYDSFKDLYLQAWQARPEGSGHLPPQQHPGRGAGDCTPAKQPEPAEPSPSARARADPMRAVIESRPAGGLASRGREDRVLDAGGPARPLYLIVSFLPVPTAGRARWTAPSSSSCPWARAANRSSGSRPACACCHWLRAAASWTARCPTCARWPGTAARCAWAPS